MRPISRVLQVVAIVAIVTCTYLLLRPLRNILITPAQLSVDIATDYAVVSSFSELVNMAGIVVIGQITPTSDTINMARDVNDITRPDPHIYVVGKVYKVDVERYIRGQGANVIYVVQPESWLDQETTLTPNAYEIGKREYNAIIPKTNTRYLIFLHSLQGFPNQRYFTGGIHPWRFDASDPNKVVPEDPWTGAIQAFPPQPLSAIIQQIQGPVGAPTPVPTTGSTIFRLRHVPDHGAFEPGGAD